MDVFYGSSKSPKESLAKAIKLNQKAIALDDSYAVTHVQVGWLNPIGISFLMACGRQVCPIRNLLMNCPSALLNFPHLDNQYILISIHNTINHNVK